MPRAAAKAVSVTYGFISVVADLYTAKAADTDSTLTQLCNGRGTHDPVKPSWDAQCPVCSATALAAQAGTPVESADVAALAGMVKRADLVKGVEVAKDSYVVFDGSEVAAMKSDDDAYKGKLALAAHDAVEVESKVLPGGSVYQMAPSKGDQFYGLLREMLLDTPDLAYVGMYTPRSRASMFRVRPLERSGTTILVAEQVIRPGEVAEIDAFTTAEPPQQMRDMALQVARGFVTPFDPDTFADTYKAKLAAEVEQRAATGGVGAIAAVTPLPTSPAADPMAAMAAQMAAFLQTATPAGSDSESAQVTDQKPKRTRKPKEHAA